MGSLTSPSTASGDRWGERLPRRLGFLSAIAVLLGSTIGSGIFRTPAVVAERVDHLGLFAAAWVLGGALSLAGALTYAELAALYPRTGGIYVFIREAFGRAPAFLFGWAELVIIRPAAYGAIAITSAEYFWRLVGVQGGAELAGGVTLAQATAAAFIVIVAAVNYRGIEAGAVVQNASTMLKIAALVTLAGLAFALSPGAPAPGPWGAEQHAAPPSPVAGFGLAMVSILWAYDGWADLSFVAGEVRNPQRALPRALLIGTALVVGLYLLANAAYLTVVPLHAMPGSALIAADVAQGILGAPGVVFVSAAVMVSTFGTLNGSMMTGPRIFFAMADDGLGVAWLARIHRRFASPANAIVLAAGLGVVFVSVRTFAELADQFVIGIWPFYALAVAAVFVLRKRHPHLDRPYRTWGYPVVPLLFLVATLGLLGTYMAAEPVTFLLDLAVILSGVPVLLYLRRRSAPPFSTSDGGLARGGPPGGHQP